jgi:hypothetical protein
MNARARHSARRRPACLALAAPMLWLAGCLIIPVDYHAAGSRRNVSPGTTGELRLGVTTAEEVFLTLGEPDFVSEDGRRLGYAWTKVKGLVFVGSYGGGTSGEIKHSYVLEVSLDETNRVSQARLLKQWGPAVTPGPELENRQ